MKIGCTESITGFRTDRGLSCVENLLKRLPDQFKRGCWDAQIKQPLPSPLLVLPVSG